MCISLVFPFIIFILYDLDRLTSMRKVDCFSRKRSDASHRFFLCNYAFWLVSLKFIGDSSTTRTTVEVKRVCQKYPNERCTFNLYIYIYFQPMNQPLHSLFCIAQYIYIYIYICIYTNELYILFVNN